MTPLDLEAELGMPGGHIFHGDLAWPWLRRRRRSRRPRPSAGAWRPRTRRMLLCGSGAVRGGAVSGLGGHNAAMAVLETRACRPVTRVTCHRRQGIRDPVLALLVFLLARR